MEKDYELLEHTADIGIKVKGNNLEKLFKNSALAMFDIMAERKKIGVAKQKEIKLEQSANNLEELFINWLNELLSLSSAMEIIFNDFNIIRLDENSLEALGNGEDINNYKVNTEIKAATYHELKIEKTHPSWEAQVIFDV